MSDFPRRNRSDLWCKGEQMISDALQQVEKMGADPILTDVVVMLGNAMERLADYVDMQVLSCCVGSVEEKLLSQFPDAHCDIGFLEKEGGCGRQWCRTCKGVSRRSKV